MIAARIAQAISVCSISCSYAGLALGIAGLLEARDVSLVALVGATVGTVGAVVYFAIASQHLKRLKL